MAVIWLFPAVLTASLLSLLPAGNPNCPGSDSAARISLVRLVAHNCLAHSWNLTTTWRGEQLKGNDEGDQRRAHNCLPMLQGRCAQATTPRLRIHGHHLQDWSDTTLASPEMLLDLDHTYWVGGLVNTCS